MRRFVALLFAALAPGLLAAATPAAGAQQYAPSLYAGMRWRMIGPYRGGRTVAVTGIPGEANLFYIAAVDGGIWKSTDAGNTWVPLFDGQPSGSIGALAVAPSDHRVLYAGSGEGLQRPDLSTGDGVYKSTDAGATWTHLGLRDGSQQIAKIVVDPHDPDLLYVAVLGHPYGANAERGVYTARTTAGARSNACCTRTRTRAPSSFAMSPRDPRKLYAALWAARRPPWYTGGSYERPDLGTGLFTSDDGGTTWRPLTRGLPTQAQGLGRIGLGIAPSDPSRMYALADSPKEGGLFRSDDGGESWTRVNNEERIYGRGDDFAGVTVDPANRNVVYVANTSTYRSDDGAVTFSAIKGAPGGDDYHTVWIDPANPRTILLGSDQGATLSGQRRRRRGTRGTTNRRRSSSTSRPTTRVRIACTAGSRRAAAPARPAAATTDRSPSASGIPSAPKSTATSPPGSARSKHRVRRQAHPLRLAHRPDAGRCARPPCAIPAFVSTARRRSCSRTPIRTGCISRAT